MVNYMKKNGFTIVEILAVLVIMSLIIGIAFPSIARIKTKANEKAYAEKINMIKSSAEQYIEDNANKLISNSECALNSSGQCVYNIEITLKELIQKGYFHTEKTDTNKNQGCEIRDPRQNKKCMDCTRLNIEFNKYKKVTVNIVEETTSTNPNALCEITNNTNESEVENIDNQE